MSKKLDITGSRFGKLVVVGLTDQGEWACICDCGGSVIAKGYVLRKGDRKSCGCAAPGRNLKDMTGQVFGSLTVIKQGPAHISTGGNHLARWFCKCACGKELLVKGYLLRTGKQVSCGCKRFNSMEGQLYLQKKYRAELRQIEFQLSQEEFTRLIQQNCHYCGKPPSSKFTTRNGSIVYTGIDRKHNDEDYIPGNCLPCCSHCNSMKLDLSYEDFIEKIRLLYYRLCN